MAKVSGVVEVWWRGVGAGEGRGRGGEGGEKRERVWVGFLGDFELGEEEGVGGVVVGATVVVAACDRPRRWWRGAAGGIWPGI